MKRRARWSALLAVALSVWTCLHLVADRGDLADRGFAASIWSFGLVSPAKAEEGSAIARGWVSAIALNVRSQPGTGSEIIGFLFRGDAVDIFASRRVGRGGWYLIVDASGYVNGWVSAGYVSGEPVDSGFIVPDDYKEPVTPSVVRGIDAQYIGGESCRECHVKPHGAFATGEYGVWQEHYHSDAYATLKRPYSRKFAEKRGIDDSLTDWRCVKCHVTAYGVAARRLGPGYRAEEGVGCEACHGPASEYLHTHYKKGISPAALAASGFRRLTDLATRDAFCRTCHNELSPTYKPFNVVQFSEAIRHWDAEFEGEGMPPVVQTFVAQKAATLGAIDVKPAKRPVVPPTTPASSAQAGQPSPPEQGARPPEPRTPPPAAPPGGGDPRVAAVSNDFVLNRSDDRTKPSVPFSHLKHLGYVETEREAESCQVCHHTTKAGATPLSCGSCHQFDSTPTAPSRQKAFHGSCRNCHKDVGEGPTKCVQCHVL